MENVSFPGKPGKQPHASEAVGSDRNQRSTASETARENGDPAFLYCTSDPYPQVEPGEYELYCTEAKPYLDPGLKVWKCRYRFVNPMQEGFPALYGFIHLGKDSKPPGRRSRYFHEWGIANGEPARKRQAMSSRVFKGKFFRVRVDWVSNRRHDGKLHTDASRYSLVKEILALACSGVSKSPSIEVHKRPSKEGSAQSSHSGRDKSEPLQE